MKTLQQLMKISIMLIFSVNAFALQADKQAHIIVSSMVVKLTEQNSSKKAAIALGLGLGVIKEVYDSTQPNNKFSLKDLAADVAGSVLGGYLDKPFGVYSINSKPCFGFRLEF
jgi:uncharacterized protein YfiM (DUF2279 family)